MNSASRLLALLDHLLARTPHSATGPALKAWQAAIFGPGEMPAGVDEDAVVLAIQAVRTELDLASSLLAARGIPTDLYDSQFSRVRATTHPLQMGASWSGMVGNIIQPDIRLAFGWAAAVLPEEEDAFSSSERSELSEALDQFLVQLDGAELPASVASFIRRQTEAIRMALSLYEVKGIKALREAAESLAGAQLMATAATVVDASSSEEAKSWMTRANGFLVRVLETCVKLDKAHKGAEALTAFAEKLQVGWSMLRLSGGEG